MSWVVSEETQPETQTQEKVKIYIDNEFFNEVEKTVEAIKQGIRDAAVSKGYAKVYVLYKDSQGAMHPLSPAELENVLNDIVEIHIYKLDYAG